MLDLLPKKKVKGIDVSGYQVNVPWKALIDNAGLGFAIVKGDQMTATDNHMFLAREAGVPIVGEYFWCDPTSDAGYLASWFANDIREHKPDFVWLDVEQYWASWTEYFDAIAGKIKWTDVKHLSSIVISNHAKKIADLLQVEFPNLVIGIYSATWFTQTHSPDMVSWIAKYPLYWAHYFDGSLGKRVVTWEYLNNTPPDPFTVLMPVGTELEWDIWQYSSTMITPAQYANYDWAVYKGTLEEMLAAVKKELTGVPMATIYKQSVPQKDRAEILTYRGDQALTPGTTFTSTKAKAIVLPMGGMDRNLGNQPTLYSEPTFKGRLGIVHAAGLPVIGRFNLKPGYYRIRQYGDTTIKNQSCNPGTTDAEKEQGVRDNFVLPYLLSSWCDGAFSWDRLFSRQMSWLPLEMLEVGVNSVDSFKGEKEIDLWMGLALKHVLQPLRWLMLRNYIPTKKIALFTGPWILGDPSYPVDGEMNTFISNCKDYLYLHLAQWTQVNTKTFPTVSELWQYRPLETFQWTYGSSKWYPLAGFEERVFGHEYSDESLKVSEIVDGSGAASTVSLSLHNSTTEDLYKLLEWTGAPVVVPPVEPPVVVPGTIVTLADAIAAIVALQLWQAKIRGA
jgi:GH25 family lysozyme M1 (1,4-beta-N-acetylmuramidase)